ncbi:hypothetical protein AOQ72_04250 [Bradyrhizobium yuanmingense]|uniref:Uncharacterized protein n=1 Tax=Bradyrhizobium yuanmingense TaxID=108015 RepID=A0A0R3BKD2_9BRAD|nr:hypothetical protein AOQ72_04250 [Bradyrhizobium yuanmingense]
MEPTIVLQPLRSCQGSQAPLALVANAHIHINEAIACSLAPHAPARVVDQANGRSSAGLEIW